MTKSGILCALVSPEKRSNQIQVGAVQHGYTSKVVLSVSNVDFTSPSTKERLQGISTTRVQLNVELAYRGS